MDHVAFKGCSILFLIFLHSCFKAADQIRAHYISITAGLQGRAWSAQAAQSG